MNPVSRWQSALETILIGLGLLAFWPTVFGYTGRWYSAALILIALALSILASIRYRRFLQAMKTDQPTKPRT